jgi:hypothetical protein
MTYCYPACGKWTYSQPQAHSLLIRNGFSLSSFFAFVQCALAFPDGCNP